MKTFTKSIGAVGLLFLASSANAVTVNKIQNGSFEADVGLSGDSWNVFDNIPGGWAKTSGAGIEVQRGNVGGSLAYDGVQKVELDSHNNSGMTQSVFLDAGAYQFSFAYRGRTGNTTTNGIDYNITGTTVAGTANGVLADGWSIYSHQFSLVAPTTVAINFLAVGTSDSLGGYIDDVKLTAVPVPAAAYLFGSALLGMVGIGYRRNKKLV